jgi:hypothetical protein
VNVYEGLDLFDTSLPLFERSLIDPESPALNEDGEFPENDLNVSYNSEILKRLNLINRQPSSSNGIVNSPKKDLSILISLVIRITNYF